MKKQRLLFLLIAACFLFTACKNTSQSTKIAQKEQRIVSLNGAITEIVYNLGHKNNLVGRDVTSTYPQWIKDSVKDLGHVRSLTIESIMQLHPTLILASEQDMKTGLKQAIEKSGVKFKLFKRDFSVAGTKKLIKQVAHFLGDTLDEKNMLTQIDRDLAKVDTFQKKPKVLFIYARGSGTLLVSGDDTPVAKMINLAGGQNAITGMSDFKPLTEEALLESNPDVILLFNSGLKSLGGIKGLLKTIPAIAKTKAGKNKAIIAMDGGLLFDFSPRVGQAAYQLNQLLKPYAK